MQLITVQRKVLFQEICKLDVGWDNLVDAILQKWKSICNFLDSLQECTVDRFFYMYSGDNLEESQFLHGSSDSSLVAYGTCIYLKSISRSEKIYVELDTV